jgi:hypothetical protein
MKYIYIRIAPAIGQTRTFKEMIGDIDDSLKYQRYAPGDEIIFTAIVEKLSDFKYGPTQLPILIDVLKMVSDYAESLNISYQFLLHCTAKFLTSDWKNVHYLNTWAYITYKQSINRHKNRWHPESKKALFLIGKPVKHQRIGLMNIFYRNNLLDYLDYTLHLPYSRENINAIKELGIDSLQDENYLCKFLTDIQRPSNDIVLENQITNTGFEYTGFPTDLKYYKNTCLSIVSENSFTHDTGIKHTPYLTEKLFRAIVNYHPFIVIGDYGSSDYIKSLGYKTFDNFFIPSNNKTFINTETTMAWAAKSVKYFIDNVDSNKDAIRELVSHNFNHFMNQTEQEIKGLKSKLPYLDLNDNELTGKL